MRSGQSADRADAGQIYSRQRSRKTAKSTKCAFRRMDAWQETHRGEGWLDEIFTCFGLWPGFGWFCNGHGRRIGAGCPSYAAPFETCKPAPVGNKPLQKPPHCGASLFFNGSRSASQLQGWIDAFGSVLTQRFFTRPYFKKTVRRFFLIDVVNLVTIEIIFQYIVEGKLSVYKFNVNS